jgi:retinol-binding protein 3
MSRKTLFALMMAAGSLFMAGVSNAQARRNQPDKTISAETRQQVIKTAIQKLKASYVFPEIADKMEAALNEHSQKGDYDKVTSAANFAQLLTDHLQAISKDKHLRVLYRYEAIPERSQEDRDMPDPEEQARYQQFMKDINYGFEKVERLRGNIGYIDLRGFFDPENGGEVVASAMNFLANTNALIFDLRQNGGGDPAMVAVICSYLFGGEPVHLNDIYDRPQNSTQQFWTLPYVPGKRYLNKDVYVLTSNRTFSGAEEFSYNLKNLKRATIVGETTGGGANPGGSERLDAHFEMFLPTGRAISPITKTNWEGTGVTPHIAVSAEQALDTAHLMALKKTLAATKDARRQEALQDAIEEIQKRVDAKQKETAKKE